VSEPGPFADRYCAPHGHVPHHGVHQPCVFERPAERWLGPAVATLASRDILLFAFPATVRLRGPRLPGARCMLPVVSHRRPGPGSVRNRNSFDAPLWLGNRVCGATHTRRSDAATSGYDGDAMWPADHPTELASHSTDRVANVAQVPHGATARRHASTTHLRLPLCAHTARERVYLSGASTVGERGKGRSARSRLRRQLLPGVRLRLQGSG
jgi:hypothetical protein